MILLKHTLQLIDPFRESLGGARSALLVYGGNFDIILDRFLRIFQLLPLHTASREILYLVPILGADFGLFLALCHTRRLTYSVSTSLVPMLGADWGLGIAWCLQHPMVLIGD